MTASAPTVGTRNWVATWTSSPTGIPDEKTIDALKNGDHPAGDAVVLKGTVRFRLRIAQGGEAVRLTFSNLDKQTVTIARATIAIAQEGLRAVAGSVRELRFGGVEGIRVPPGGPVISDPVPFEVAAGATLLVSIYVPDGMTVWGMASATVEYGPVVVDGDQTRLDALPSPRPVNARPLPSRVDVLSSTTRGVIVAFGDSITDGTIAPNGDRGWPGVLARRLAGQGYSVVNAGIGGNRLLLPAGSMQPAALARMDSDVLAAPGITHIILLEAINDISSAGIALPFFGPSPPLTLQDVTGAYAQIIARAHLRGIKVIGGTITPIGGSPAFTAEKEAMRQAINAWIRTSKAFDDVIDFDVILRDPADPVRMQEEYHSGDHLHPGAAGFRAMGEGIDLDLFP